MADKDLQCSFCGRPKADVDILIAGATGHICERCVDQAQAIVAEEGGAQLRHNLPLTSPCADLQKSRPTSTSLSLVKTPQNEP